MGRRYKRMTKDRPKFVVRDVTRSGVERIYLREPGKKKIRLRGPIGSEDFWADYAAARDGRLQPREKRVYRGALPPAGTFARLVVDYYGSKPFRDLHPDTRYRRRLILDPLREEFGEFPAAKLEGKHIRRMRDARAVSPESANGLIKALRQLYRFGVEYGYVRSNPAREIATIKRKGTGYHTWSPEEIAQYQEHWPVGTQQRLAFDLMLYTGVRRSDAVSLGRQHLKDGRLIFTPEKTRERGAKMLAIPVHPDLAASIAAAQGGDLTFLVNAYGRPWGSGGAADASRIKHRAAGFGNVFKDWCVAAGLPHCSAHGLRKAATVRLIEAGCTPYEAAAITGHESMRVLEIYARERDRRGLADIAMQKLIEKGARDADPAEKVPLDDPMQNHGTLENPKPLKGKRSWKSLAPRAGLEPATIRLTVECSTN